WTVPLISTCRPSSWRTSPIFLRSDGNTTTVKGHALSLQKFRILAPLRPSCTCSTVPLTQALVPTCLLASANETQLLGEILRAEQTPLIIRTVPKKKVRVRTRIITEAGKRAFSFNSMRGGEALRQSGRKISQKLPEKGSCRGPQHARFWRDGVERWGSAPACHSSRGHKQCERATC